ncbi:ribosome maturation factor RimM [Thiomicrospira sp. WB1]|jgi:16S rRNA processing protein RimM|uniref:ribosome maturation factor RimM n=1 Tax=Thiomicrospira sp. WB1 TaxID=1685380 RepID=UPI000748225A|nr:ribosome maturation factor RimM [Thiomicrospira sp. WB1]KUJ72743.1 ribosome maturation factor RimM [Thiomicrospira sp. WB1]
MAQTDSTPLVIGRIHGIYGVKGWVKVFSHTDPRENILRYTPWLVQVEGQWRAWPVRSQKVLNGGKTLVAHLEGIDDRDQARALMGAEIAVYPHQLPELEKGYYWCDLIGATVADAAGQTLGVISEMIETGAHDVMRVADASEQTVALIPFVEGTFVKHVDLEAGRIEVDWTDEGEPHNAV